MIGTINGKPVEFSENETILQVAKRNGHFIPTLCEMADLDHTPGTCRVCLVEIQRRNGSGPQVVTSCNTPMEEGMAVLTRTPALREQQRLQVELLLADHNQDCAVCIRHGNCELQDVAQFVGLQQSRYRYPHFYEQRTRDDSSAAIVRDMSKCIRCLRCVKVCREIQGTDALVITEKGLATEISVRDSLPLGSSDCVACGQCILVCPVGALAERDDTETVIDYLYDPRIVTVFQFAPAIRVALGEAFRMPAGENVEGQIVTALKHLGADVVLDTNFTADLVIMEEGTELLHRIEKGGDAAHVYLLLPRLGDLCREKLSGDFAPHLHHPVPPTMLRLHGQNLSGRGDGHRSQNHAGNFHHALHGQKRGGQASLNSSRGTPRMWIVVLTTREFARLLEREGVDLSVLEPSAYDNPWMGDYTGAAAIFGTTGGVMEAALRTVHKVVTGDELEGIEFQPVRGNEKVREARGRLKNGAPPVKVAVAHSLKAARQVAEMVLAGEAPYHFIEIMACPGGCMGGGGQPRNKKAYQASWEERQNALYAIDRQRAVRQSHNNPLIEKLYDDFLEKPNSHKAHELLHTTYRERKRIVKHTMKEIWQEIETR